jgi:hypothetical protein
MYRVLNDQDIPDPNEMQREIEKSNNRNNKSRIVAGYCWD